MKNFVAEGDTVSLVAPNGAQAGTIVFINDLYGVAVNTVNSGGTVHLKRTGVFDVEKTYAQAWEAGEAVYWVPNTGKVSNSGSGNIFLGYALADAANPSDYGRIVIV